MVVWGQYNISNIPVRLTGDSFYVNIRQSIEDKLAKKRDEDEFILSVCSGIK